MIKTQDKLFANLVKQRHLDLPLEPLTRVVNLAAVALGVLRSKSLQVGQIITSLPLEGIRDSLKKRVQRFLKNPEVEVEVYQEPVARRILQRLVEGGARVSLILDRTEWGVCNILYVSVRWRGRALPLVWRALGPGASSFAEQKELLAVVAGWLPQGAKVPLLGDREFGTGVLAQWALAQGWGGASGLRPISMCAEPGLPTVRCCPLFGGGSGAFGLTCSLPKLPPNPPVNWPVLPTKKDSVWRKCLRTLKTTGAALAWSSPACAMPSAWSGCVWLWP